MLGCLSTLGSGVLVLSAGADGISAALVVNVLLLLLVYRRNNLVIITITNQHPWLKALKALANVLMHHHVFVSEISIEKY
jgi:hypothetical protein